MTIPEMQLVCDYILKQENKPLVFVYQKQARCSQAQYRRDGQKIRITSFIFDYPAEIQLAEIIHETCHFVLPYQNHGIIFRQKEIYWLSQFGLKPVKYRRAYYTFIKTLNGDIIPTRPTEENPDYLEKQKLALVSSAETTRLLLKEIAKIFRQTIKKTDNIAL